MFGKDFYPTPLAVIKRMLKPFETRHGYSLSGRSILEPSAGKGDIADFINKPNRPHYSSGYSLDCIEFDPNLVSVLQGNRHKVVGNDFLKWHPSKVYDLIIMNPPFSEGDKHLLHAWNCLSGGDIVCLLNEETVKNPCTKIRKLLAEIIMRHGEVECLGACFDTAERKTGVNVALVRLNKPMQDKYKAMFEKAKFQDLTIEEEEKPQEIFLPANRDMVGTLVLQYKESLKLFKQSLIMTTRLGTALKSVRGGHVRDTGFSSVNTHDYVVNNLFSRNFTEAYNDFVEQLTKDAWKNVLNMCGLDQLMTKKVRESFERQVETNMTMAFSEDNIYALLDGLRHNVDSIMKDALCEVFDLLTKYHEENRVHVEGWKTNDMYKVGKKFILPGMVQFDWDRFRMNYHGRDQQLRDIDRVMCSLEGIKIENIVTVQEALSQSFGPTNPGEIESEFFKLRYYKKGTVHFTFKDNALRERFCIEYAKEKSWLPHDYNYKEHGAIPELASSFSQAA